MLIVTRGKSRCCLSVGETGVILTKNFSCSFLFLAIYKSTTYFIVLSVEARALIALIRLIADASALIPQLPNLFSASTTSETVNVVGINPTSGFCVRI